MTTAIAPLLYSDVLEVRDVPVVSIFPSPTNPRRSIDQVKIEELAQSIRSVGIQVPLTLRATADGFEIVGGERRWRAAKLVGLNLVPAIVRVKMTDEECREAQLIENLQREDLDALDEADAYQVLLEALGSTQAIAAKSGKSIEHVTRVLKLRALTVLSRHALSSKLITVDHALLLARLAEAEQEKALRFTLRPGATRKEKTEDIILSSLKDLQAKPGSGWRSGYWQPQSVLNLKSFIERSIKLELRRAPWDLTNPELLEYAGACSNCPKNTAHNTALFGDLAIEEAVCTDAVCFNGKRDAFVQLQLKAIAAAGKEAVRISWKRTSAKPSKLNADGEVLGYYAQVFKDGQWIEARKGSCVHVRTGVTVDFEESTYGDVDAKKKPGRQLLVCVSAGCKVHRKEWEKPASANRNAPYDAKAEKEKRKKTAAIAEAENIIRAELAKKALEKVRTTKGFFPDVAVRDLVLQSVGYGFEKRCPDWMKALRSASMVGAEYAQAVSALYLWDCNLEISLYHSPEAGRKKFLAALKTLGVDGSSAWAKPEAKKAEPAKPAKKKPAKKAAVSKKPAKKGGRK